jgi:hypothetical protein
MSCGEVHGDVRRKITRVYLRYGASQDVDRPTLAIHEIPTAVPIAAASRRARRKRLDKDDLVDSVKSFYGRANSEANGDFTPEGMRQIGASEDKAEFDEHLKWLAQHKVDKIGNSASGT